MLKKTLSILTLTTILVFLCGCVAFASPANIVAEGQYIFTASDTRETAKKAAVKNAMRYAAEQGAVYVEAYSEANKLNLTKDEVETVAAAIVKVYDEKISYSHNGTVCHATIYCTVDTDGIDVDKILRRYRGGQKNNGEQQSRQPVAPQVRYSGVIIDTFDIDTYDLILNGVVTHTAIISEDGRIVYDSMTPEPKYGDEIVWISNGADVDNERGAGRRPYWAKALYVYNPNHERFTGTIVISNADADAILAQQKAYGILNGKKRGNIVVISRR